MFKKIRIWWIFLTNNRVLNAINNGATYDEVMAIVEEELKK